MEKDKEPDTANQRAAKAESVTARDIKEFTHDVRELRDRKYSVENESKHLSAQVEKLKAELVGADVVIASLRNDIKVSRTRIEEYPEILKELEVKKEALIGEINRCQSGIKTTTKNIKNFLTMRGHLERELMEIINEKAIVIKKLRDMEDGVRMVASKKEEKMPHLKEYDMFLQQLSKVFREVENRMDVSIKFSTKKMS